MIWLLVALVLGLLACVATAPSLRCRLGLHRWRRRPLLAPGLTWHAVCDRCELDRDQLRGVAP